MFIKQNDCKYFQILSLVFCESLLDHIFLKQISFNKNNSDSKIQSFLSVISVEIESILFKKSLISEHSLICKVSKLQTSE